MTPPPSKRLMDGSEPVSPEELFQRFEELDIVVRTVRHPPVFTVEEAKALRGDLPGGHTKNLFLRNKKGAMWLFVCPESRPVELQPLAKRLGAGRFSFASAERLMKYLGVVPGAVTPFAVINDKGGHVRVVLDRAVLAEEPLNFHPLDNSMTTAIGADDFLRFLEAESHPPELIELDRAFGESRDTRSGLEAL